MVEHTVKEEEEDEVFGFVWLIAYGRLLSSHPILLTRVGGNFARKVVRNPW